MQLLDGLKKQWHLLGLLLFAFVSRLFYLVGNTIPFSFDHGKDSLAIMDLVVNLSPKFIGPWTSIPGLYFGPAWYYILAPFYWLFGFNPVGGAFAMLLLVLLQIFLAYKYFGKYEALILACAPMWFILSKGAWNPYPMTLATIGVLILLKKAIAQRVLTPRLAFGLGFVAAFGFHFSAAFAIFYPVIVVAALLIFRVRFRLKQVALAAFGFFLPFLPQLLFELRYNFSQARAIVRYFQEGEDHTFSFAKILEVLHTTFGEIRLCILPETNYLGSFSGVVLTMLVAALAVVIYRHRHQEETRQNFLLAALFVLIPVGGFFFLHFNVWYVYAITPAVVLLMASSIRMAPKWLQISTAMLLLLGPVMMYLQYFSADRDTLLQSRGFLPIKIQTLDRIEEIAAGRPYASYHYVPDIYDFSYQYLYFWRAYHGHTLPTEFSYKPGESSYVVQKPDLLERFPAPHTEPEVIFYVVENPENSEFLASWWNQQQFGAIQQEIEMSPSVKLYVATP